MNQDSGFRIQGSGFRIQGSGFRVQDSGFRIAAAAAISHGRDAYTALLLAASHGGEPGMHTGEDQVTHESRVMMGVSQGCTLGRTR